MTSFDIIVLGSGPGGYVAAIRAAQLGKKVGIVEREALGGICLNWGCIPTKALLKSASVFEYINHAADYGIHVQSATADFNGVIKRSRKIADDMSKGVQFLMKKNKITVLMGNGVFNADKTLTVTVADGKTEIISAPHIIVATGGRAKELPNLKIDGTRVIEYRKAMTLEKMPEHIVIVGAGAIGVEFAYFYHSMGSKVTIVEFMDQGLLPREDADISKELAKIYSKKGMTILAGTSVESVVTSGKISKVFVKNKATGVTSTIECDIILSAAGVTPNTENIGLEKIGVKTDRGFVVVDDVYKTNVSGIYV